MEWGVSFLLLRCRLSISSSSSPGARTCPWQWFTGMSFLCSGPESRERFDTPEVSRKLPGTGSFHHLLSLFPYSFCSLLRLLSMGSNEAKSGNNICVSCFTVMYSDGIGGYIQAVQGLAWKKTFFGREARYGLQGQIGTFRLLGARLFSFLNGGKRPAVLCKLRTDRVRMAVFVPCSDAIPFTSLAPLHHPSIIDYSVFGQYPVDL